jgi:hypothetical protein
MVQNKCIALGFIFAPLFSFNYLLQEIRKLRVVGGIDILQVEVPLFWAGGPFNSNGTNVGEIRLRSGIHSYLMESISFEG